MIVAAGIMFVEPGGKVLFLKRGQGSDHPGEWCFPGGHVEENETVERGAIREAIEELGFLPEGARRVWTRGVGPAGIDAVEPVDYTTFIQRVESQFEPQTDGEHTGWAWASINEPPEPLHPGCRIALLRAGMNETDVAQAVANGELTSPQRFENVWLFAVRITGTGAAYRSALKEYVYRQPEAYLTPEFLERCHGLPVIWKHPPKSLLTSDEFSERIIGSIVKPYINGDEVWGVAKIYDDEAAAIMAAGKMSTSPGVKGGLDNRKLTLEDGSALLIEGEPGLLDHLAVCELGVWDKGGPPAGISSENGVALMTEEEKKAAEEKATADKRKDADKTETEKAEEEEARKKADAATVAPLDKVLSHLDAMSKRFDAMDKRFDAMECDSKARKDAEEKEKSEREDRARRDAMSEEDRKREDAKRKDAEEKETKEREDKARKDAEAEKEKARADSDAKILAELAELRARQPRERTDDDQAKFAATQARCDAVAAVWGKQAPRQMSGEEHLDYRIRLAGAYKSHSKAWAGIDLSVLPEPALAIAEQAIYADAMTAAIHPADGGKSFGLRAIPKRDAAGRTITEFVGDAGSWLNTFSMPRRRVRSFNTGNN